MRYLELQSLPQHDHIDQNPNCIKSAFIHSEFLPAVSVEGYHFPSLYNKVASNGTGPQVQIKKKYWITDGADEIHYDFATFNSELFVVSTIKVMNLTS